ncbi:MAG: hypothetical protein KJZ75_11145 [Hyphomonadaceae bacterium]|nr:hypothetical protein [Hyphomonadaceae bacterium]
MTAVWPADLPPYVEAGSSETLPRERIESSLANGPEQTRRRIYGKTREFDVMLFCDESKIAAFEAFYRDTLKDGVLAFTGLHPRTRAAGVFKFKGPPPAYAARGTGQAVLISFKLGQVR